MNTVAIIKITWIATVFATSALVSQTLMDTTNPASVLLGEGGKSPSDAGTKLPRNYAFAGRDEVVARSSWDQEL